MKSKIKFVETSFGNSSGHKYLSNILNNLKNDNSKRSVAKFIQNSYKVIKELNSLNYNKDEILTIYINSKIKESNQIFNNIENGQKIISHITYCLKTYRKNISKK